MGDVTKVGMGEVRGDRSNLALYFAARGTGQVAHNLVTASFLVIASSGAHAAVGLSSFAVATTLTALLFGIPGGSLADRLGPGRGFALGAGLRAMVVAAALMAFHTPASLTFVAVAYTAVSQIHNSSEMALVKVLCDRSAGRIHSLLVAMQYAGQGLGFLVLAPALYLIGEVQAVLAGALALGLLHLLAANVLALRLAGCSEGIARMAGPFSGMRETLRVFARSEAARDALAVFSMKALVAQVILVAFPIYLKNDLDLGTEGAAYVLVPGVLGVAAGLIWAAMSLSLDGAVRAMRLSIAGLAVSVFALAALDYGVTAAFEYSQVPPLVRFEAALNMPVLVAMPVAFLIGASLSVALVSARAALTAAAPVGIQSRVFAVQSTVSDAILVVPLLLAGVAAETVGARMTLAALGTLCSVTCLLMWHPRFQLAIFSRRAEQEA